MDMKDRLTYRTDETANQKANFNWTDALERLCEYEDSGLSPHEVKDLKVAWGMYGGEYGINELIAAEDGWISCDKLLPKENNRYNVVVHPMLDEHLKELNFPDTRFVTEMYFDADQQIWKGDSADSCYNADLTKVNKKNSYFITHWRPLPGLPKDEYDVK